MVFFSCDGCAEMLKKNQVDNHAKRCRDCSSVSCVDCSVSFWGDDYKSHTSCISEAERYEKSIYKGPRKNDKSNRKLTPQEQWMELIQESISVAPPAIIGYIEQLLTMENVPRKEKPFRNFAQNSLKLNRQDANHVVSSLWSHLHSFRQQKLSVKEEETSTRSLPPINKSIASLSIDESMISDDILHTSTANITEENKNETTSMNKKPFTKKNKEMKKVVKKALKKAPQRQLKFKEMRKILQEKGISINDKFKATMSRIAEKSNKRIVIEGKVMKLNKG